MADPDGTEPEPRGSAAQERFQRIYHTLRTRISLLDYPPGMRLSETALAEEFGISRTPLRGVLKRLESEQLLETRHGVGTIVTDIDVTALAQVYMLRMELAEMIGRLSPAQPSEETQTLFRDLRARSQALIRDPDPRVFAQLNMDFFHALMRLTDNEPLRDISERLYYQTARIWLKSIPRMDMAEEITTFAREVADTAAAVEIGDISAAGHIRRSHISMSFTRLRQGRG